MKPNPRLSLAREGVKKAIAFQADMILAVGGGSVIDTAKAVAHGAANPDKDHLGRILDAERTGDKVPSGRSGSYDCGCRK